ncbi:hypothetical protein [Stieleria varia]|uniref:Secreted protein n=1 Tax=Stieleria varia TaxID=2528005 RepID=A0A5C5ZLB3_9BACT|nr:hypothetical protein [Stieleria varia]TWT87988.1 hypothetical protein Pla52n_69450 [Stieleria varia]
MVRFAYTLAFLMLLAPTFVGCGGSSEPKVITGNDQAAIDAEAAQSDNQEFPGETPGPKPSAAQSNDP